MLWVPATGTIDGEEKVLNSTYMKKDTYVARTSGGEIQLTFEWTEEGAILSEQITCRMTGQPLGIFKGEGEGAQPLLGDDGRPIAPTVRAVIKDRGDITGLSLSEAMELSRQLNEAR